MASSRGLGRDSVVRIRVHSALSRKQRAGPETFKRTRNPMTSKAAEYNRSQIPTTDIQNQWTVVPARTLKTSTPLRLNGQSWLGLVSLLQPSKHRHVTTTVARSPRLVEYQVTSRNRKVRLDTCSCNGSYLKFHAESYCPIRRTWKRTATS
jgi:hypothetical protein